MERDLGGRGTERKEIGGDRKGSLGLVQHAGWGSGGPPACSHCIRRPWSSWGLPPCPQETRSCWAVSKQELQATWHLYFSLWISKSRSRFVFLMWQNDFIHLSTHLPLFEFLYYYYFYYYLCSVSQHILLPREQRVSFAAPHPLTLRADKPLGCLAQGQPRPWRIYQGGWRLSCWLSWPSLGRTHCVQHAFSSSTVQVTEGILVPQTSLGFQSAASAGPLGARPQLSSFYSHPVW